MKKIDLEKVIEKITQIEKDDLTIDEKKKCIIQLLNELMPKLSEFDKSNIEVYKNSLIYTTDIKLGITCFYLKIYLNEIKWWY